MLIVENNLETALPFLEHLRPGECVLDIETTGFDRRSDQLLLAGCLYRSPDGIRSVQWLGERPADEYELLYRLREFLSPFKTLAHYNGTAFDLPFLGARFRSFGLESPLEDLGQYDLYLRLRPCKQALGFPGLRLQVLAAHFGLGRTDNSSGFLLARTHREFLEGHRRDLAQPLLVHNREDLENTLVLLALRPLLETVLQLKENRFHPESFSLEREEDQITFLFRLEQRHFGTAAFDGSGHRILLQGSLLSLHLPIRPLSLLHYFSDYRNYYYLPKEDTAIHKSVGRFVAPGHRVQAGKDTAFVRKSGLFVELPAVLGPHLKGLPLFHKDPRREHVYVEASALASLDPRLLGPLLGPGVWRLFLEGEPHISLTDFPASKGNSEVIPDL
ncbi:ribonuclease H-like domain-containing protein [Anaerotalea alkaliphila]|uniref:Ribonuclease H-like domain-containing protein n=1 Tax=Anaerotalea alkaliphila TaxID=2662126 RepID=A0A7X5HTE8_9FIRM|nr:ribonuclease H-like domain-containing protein [Anaerotalea alkaliphila]NDL66306.1 ribonuclease H-like domain-containing protein [Anaerotalea alkaliphila]